MRKVRLQCVTAPDAPMPVWDRTYCASNPPRSTLARTLRSRTENSQMPANASVIENLKKMGEPTEIDHKPAIVLPLRFSDGAIYLGMLPLGDAPALF